MESDYYYSVLDYVSVFTPILLVGVTCLTIRHRLKMRWPVKVNCWFCNENTKIYRQDLDWWLCSWCDQYNGFCKNGDYTYEIPEQYAASNTKYCRSAQGSKKSINVPKRSLCVDCNKREGLKLSKLSNFEPQNEKAFNAELKVFREYLERTYPLCDNCTSVVQDLLSKQALWLTYYKMLFFRQKSVVALVSNARRRTSAAFRIVSTILTSIIMYSIIVHSHDSMWPLIGGLFFHLCVSASSTKRRNSDVLLTLLWFCMIVLVSTKKKLTILRNAWLTADHIVQYNMITVCASLISLVSVKPSSCGNKSTGWVAFKKLKSRSRDDVASQFTYNQSKDSSVSGETDNSIESVSVAGELSSFTDIKSNLTISRQKLPTIPASASGGSYSHAVPQSGPADNCLHDSLSTLFLSEEPVRFSRSARATPVIFERKVYNATSSESLFRRCTSSFGRKRCVLSPPKLRSVTQTSWVAGGYWQDGMMTAAPSPSPPMTLSRSSSQSSGFGSAGSNLAPSREPSVLNDALDRCSVMSDATRWSCHTPPPPPLSPPPPSSSSSSSSSRAQSRRHDTARSRSRYAPSTRTTRDLDDARGHVRRPNPGGRDDLAPVYANHTTTTVLATSVWLFALLCGSLILNMIVLCTMLMR